MRPSPLPYLVTSLAEMPVFMRRALADLPVALLRQQLASDKSPFLEHAWHVRDCESELYVARIERVLTEDNPFLEPMSVSHWPLERRYLERPLEQALLEFEGARTRLLARLADLNPQALERTGQRANGRASTVADLLLELHEHDQDHRVRIATMLARLASPSAA
jgi:hypothetical protein